MPDPDQDADHYRHGLREAHDGEVAAAAYFQALAQAQPQARARQALQLMAAIERSTAHALAPALARAGLQPTPPETLRARWTDRAAEDAAQPWEAMVQHMLADYPPYIEQFRGLARHAPAADGDAMAALIAHEVALVEFARREAAGDGDSLDVLHAHLARWPEPA